MSNTLELHAASYVFIELTGWSQPKAFRAECRNVSRLGPLKKARYKAHYKARSSREFSEAPIHPCSHRLLFVERGFQRGFLTRSSSYPTPGPKFAHCHLFRVGRRRAACVSLTRVHYAGLLILISRQPLGPHHYALSLQTTLNLDRLHLNQLHR